MRTPLARVGLVAAAMLCCTAAAGPRAKPTPAPSEAPKSRAKGEPPAPAAKSASRSVVVFVGARDGDLAKLLAKHVALARKAHLKPYLEFSAEWCKPCVAFKHFLDDPMMQDALAGTYLVIADYDAFGKDATRMGVRGVPTWLELDGGGRPTGRSITSSVWGEDIPANMAPPLTLFFAGER